MIQLLPFPVQCVHFFDHVTEFASYPFGREKLDLGAMRENFLKEIVRRIEPVFEDGILRVAFHLILRSVQRQRTEILAFVSRLGDFQTDRFHIQLGINYYPKRISKIRFRIKRVGEDERFVRRLYPFHPV